MNLRLKFSRFLLRLGAFIQSLPVAVMKPNDLVEFSRQSYDSPQDVEGWSEDSLVDSGLTPDELILLEILPTRKGNLLLLGVGGGREAIVLAKMGFDVTGVDYVPGMVERAKENAEKRGITIQGITQEISNLDVAAETYDVVWISRSMYSCVPTRARRVEMSRRIHAALKPGGYFVCQFHWAPTVYPSRKVAFLRRLIAIFTLGNFAYEGGDMLWLNVEFLHAFASEVVLQSELEEGGFINVKIKVNPNTPRAGAICQKNMNTIHTLDKEKQ